MCCISVLFVLHILRTIKREFSHLITSKMQHQSDSKRKPPHPQPQRVLVHKSPYISSDDMNCKEPQSTTNRSGYSRNAFRSPLRREDTATFTVSEHTMSGMYGRRLISSAVSNTSTVSTMGSVNESALSGTEDAMKYEIRRMRNLQIGLYLLIVVFLMNALFNGLLRFYQPGRFWFFEDTKDDENIYVRTPTEIVAVVFFPQWTIINVFILMFSWIPDSRLVESWND